TDERAGGSARAVGALAYTVGRHVVFAPGLYDPQSARGRRLLAHELTHVIQQNGLNRPTPGSVPMDDSGSHLEDQAENAARRADPTGAATFAPSRPAFGGKSISPSVHRERGPDVRLDMGVHQDGQMK